MVTAAAQDQWRLLDVQDHDTRLNQIAHRRQTLPEHAQLASLEGRLARISDQLVLARTTSTDVSRELTKAEADVEQVRQRAARDRSRLDSGQGAAKELQGLQHELESLAARQAVLEDAELEVMERQEAAEAAVAAILADQQALTSELATVRAARDRQLGAFDEEAAAVRRQRNDAVAGLPEDLVALYERVRANAGGVGAARLHQRRCEGCRLEIPPNDLARIRSSADDAVTRCEECGRILVRTPDSGL